MSKPLISTDDCIGCGICVDACPQEVLEVDGGVCVVANEESCIACGLRRLPGRVPHGRHHRNPRGLRYPQNSAPEKPWPLWPGLFLCREECFGGASEGNGRVTEQMQTDADGRFGLQLRTKDQVN